jgi:hypothetical protein
MSKPDRSVGPWPMLAAALLSALPTMTLADVFVIAHTGLAASAEDIRDIYTGEKEMLGSVKLRPLDNHAAQSEFLSKALSLNAGRYEALWAMKSFRDGLTPPAAKNSDEEVIAYVQATPGAIGYVTSAPPASVTVLRKF